MMSFEKFIEWVADDLQRLLGEDYRIESTSVRKNNGVELKALIVRNKNHNAAPVIYMEPLYQTYKKGSSIEALTKKILVRMKNELPFSMEITEKVYNLETVRDRIGYRLISKSKNEELLKDIPWTPWQDLAIIYYLNMGVKDNNQVSTIIYNHQMKKWNLSEDDLYELAKENMPKMCPSVIGRLDHLIFGFDKDEDEIISCDPRFPVLYVLSNQANINGASSVLYNGVLKDFAERLDSDLIILPSSVHEVLLLRYSETVDLEMFKNLVRSVNAEDVPEEDVLSDSVYLYSREKDQISMV